MSQNAPTLEHFLARAERLLERLEPLLPPASPAPDWNAAAAFRWRKRGGVGFLQAIAQPATIRLADLQDIDEQKARIVANTRQFLKKKPANNVLLTGARGSGKSSLIKALLNEYAGAGLRVIEVDKNDLVDLPDIVELVAGRRERFIVFCDDLSFDAGDATFKALKVILDGSLASAPDNVLIYATSNRRHLVTERAADNLSHYRDDSGELHPGDTVEEKTSLSERFGLWLSFYPFKQDDYLTIVDTAVRRLGYTPANDAEFDDMRTAALQFTLERGSRSARIAQHFARHWVGQQQLAMKRRTQ